MSGEDFPARYRHGLQYVEAEDRRTILGPGVRVTFHWLGDRWTHVLAVAGASAHEPVDIARVVEADPVRDDPTRVASPTYQELQEHSSADEVRLLLTGQSTPHHFSAVVTARREGGGVSVAFDVADRCREPVAILASTYVVLLGSSELVEATTEQLSWSGGMLGGGRLSFASDRAATLSLAEAGPCVTRAQALAPIDPAMRTHRLKYQWRWSSPEPDRSPGFPERLPDVTLFSTRSRRMQILQDKDRQVFDAIRSEERRQRDELELIASENYTSAAVMEAVGSVLTNKYAEGLPGRRYYGGCEFVDQVERLALDRVKALFGGDHANVQPHSGASANQAVYYASLEIGDRVLAMDLAQGGHLTHGMKLNFSGRWYPTTGYGVDPRTERIDYDRLATLAREHKPKLILAGASAYPRTIDFATMAAVAREVGAVFFVDMAHIAGLVAAGLHPSPVELADFVTTTTHKTLRGPRGGIAICKQEWAKKLDSAVFPGLQGGPLMHVIAGKAVCLGEALRPDFKAYGVQVIANARTLGEELTRAGFRLVSGGTDNHLILIDMTSRGLTGKIAEAALGRAGLTVNKNLIPFDTRKPMDPSGVRMGTPALTTRGMREDAIRQVAAWIVNVLAAPDDPAVAERVRGSIREFVRDYPVPSDVAASAARA